MIAASARLVIMGLGPGNPDLRTVGAQAALDAADRIILRTRVHPGLHDLAGDPRVSDCDDLYRSASEFAALYAAVADRVIEQSALGGMTVYAVPGHPRFAERTVVLIAERAAALGIPVDVLDAVSFVDVAMNAIGGDAVAAGLQVADAEHLAATLDREPYAAGQLGIDPARPLLVAQIYNAVLAAAVKLALTRLYPDDHPVTLIQGARGADGAGTVELALHELDRHEVDHLTSLWAPPLAPLDAARSPETLARLVAMLRAPGGCPWDREQTHATLRDAIIEEAYEAVDAIDDGDGASLAEELGDLLLLVMMHAQLAEEEGTFRIEDVYEEVNRKLVRRHPHVFGDVTARTPDAVVTTWERVKSVERAQKSNGAAEQSRFERLPRSMPSTRKVIEVFAPRAVLAPSPDERAGDRLLAAIRELIGAGIDPELAVEASLRQAAKGNETSSAVGVAAQSENPGEGHE